MLHAVAIPLEPGPAPLGTLVVGFSLDQDAARAIQGAHQQRHRVRRSGRRIVASTLDPERDAGLADVADQTGDLRRAGSAIEEYIGRVQPLGAAGEADEPVALVLRSRTEHLSFLPPLRWQIALTGLARRARRDASSATRIARTVTRPLRALTAHHARDGGDRRPGRTVPAAGRWDDEDARLLATTFGQLTGALDRFQREAAQRERLSSLGRLSTVVAHEIRNPLMIIKSAVRDLRQPSVAATSPSVATSIDEEVARLNRVVTDVLDFARPIRFDSRAGRSRGASAGTPPRPRQAAADDVPIAVDDAASRRRSSPTPSGCARCSSTCSHNAQQAVRARGADRPGGRRSGSRSRSRRRTGGGSTSPTAAPASPPTTCRGSSSRSSRRGAAARASAWRIARNIVEGLGGTIARRQPGQRAARPCTIDLPDRPRMRRRSRVTRGSILLVDDEPKIRQALAQALRDEGHDVDGDRQPARGAAALGERPFDLLVVDNLMPELSGLELIREVVGATRRAASGRRS